MTDRAIFIWSEWGDSHFLARRLQQEGRKVLFYVENSQGKHIGQGLVNKVDTPTVPKGALVVFDTVGHGARGQQLRLLGHPVIGGNPLDTDLERDRHRGSLIASEAGITVPESHPFTKIREAIDFLEDEEGKWYIKISGDPGTDMTMDGVPAMMIRSLKWWETVPGEKPPFELQRAVEGIEVSCEGWFDGERFVPPFNATIEDKKFLTGNLGPRTGCEANMVWALEGAKPGLPRAGVARLEGRLRRARYVGPIDMNCIVNAAGEPFWLEWSARLGFDAFPAYCRLVQGSLADHLEAFALGELDEWILSPEVAMTLRLSVPPYPTEDATRVAAKYRGAPLDVTVLHDDRISLTDVMLNVDREPCLAGRDGQVGTIGQVGTDIRTLRRELLEVANSLDVKRKQYRTDPVARAEEALAALEAHSFLSHTGLSRYLERIHSIEEEE